MKRTGEPTGLHHQRRTIETDATRERSDDELMTRVVAGDEAAFAELFKRYKAQVTWEAHNITHNKQTADEICNDTFRRVWEYSSRYTAENFRAWLLRIARNASINFMRDSKRRRELVMRHADESTAPPPLDALDTLMRQQDREQILAAMNSLANQEYQAVLRLRYAEDLSYEEIADRLGIKKGTVMSRLSRAKENLAPLLSAQLRRERPVPKQKTAEEAA